MGAEIAGKWWRRAACKGIPTDLFYISKDTKHPPPELAALCAGCPVRNPCLLYALRNYEHGVWGGTTEKQRRAMRRNYRRKSCPGCGGESVPAMDDKQYCTSCGLSWTASKVRTTRGVVKVEKPRRRE